jgi:hypothetical protein
VLRFLGGQITQTAETCVEQIRGAMARGS